MTPETITEIALEQLHESPFNPRRTFAGIDDLAANIKAEGRIHEPLLVRPRILAEGLVRRGDGQQDDGDTQDGFEIVFGHRRLRAAEAAGLATVPCMVRAMSDAEARSAQISENLQRDDIHPIEEAEGLRALIDAGDATAEQLAERLGKSLSYVYGRLKLLQACPEVRQACLDGHVLPEVALLVARLRTDKLQAKALGYIGGKFLDMGDGGKKGFRTIRDLLAEHFNTRLKGALFDTADATLLPDVGDCSTCPKRAGNAPEFSDIADDREDRPQWGRREHYGADVCTDPDCFDAKKKAHLKRQAEELRAKGKTVVDGNAARAAVSAAGQVKGAYIALKDVKATLTEAKKNPRKSLAGKDLPTPPVITIQDPRTGKTIEAVKREDLVQAGVKVPAAGDSKGGDRYAEQEARRKAERDREQVKVDAERAVRLQMLQRVRDAAAERERSAFDLQLIARAAIAGVDYGQRDVLELLWPGVLRDGGAHVLPGLGAQDLARLILDCALVAELLPRWDFNLKKMPANLQAAAEHYGIDLAAVRAEAGKPVAIVAAKKAGAAEVA
jgi:ParB/RepB/Spo0J family partition protein